MSPARLTYAAVSKDLASKLPSDKSALVIAYCGGPSCNAYTKAANAAKALGYTNVKHMSAGISGWLQAGEKTDKYIRTPRIKPDAWPRAGPPVFLARLNNAR